MESAARSRLLELHYEHDHPDLQPCLRVDSDRSRALIERGLARVVEWRGGPALAITQAGYEAASAILAEA